MLTNTQFRRTCFSALCATAISLPLTLAAQTPAPAQSGPIALVGATLHLGNGDVVESGGIVFADGRISAVGPAAGMSIPANATRIEVNGQHVYPGFILMGSNLGLVEVDAVRATQDSRELGQLNPNIRSADAYNADSELLPVTRFNGVLSAQIAPLGGLISGRSSVMQLDAWTPEEAIIRADDGVWLNWPSVRSAEFDFSTFSVNMVDNENYGQQLGELEDLFAQAASYRAVDGSDRNIKLEALGDVLSGQARLYVRTELAADFEVAMDFAQRHGIASLAWVGAAEAEALSALLAERRIPVILSSTHRNPLYADSPFDQPFRTAARLHQAGVVVAIAHQGTMNARNLAFQAGTARAYGVPDAQALAMITSVPAQLLGLQDELGTLKVGARATLFVSAGDALDMAGNQLSHAFIDGRQINLRGRQQELFERYNERYSEAD